MNTKRINKKANRRILIYLIMLITIIVSIFLTFPNYALKIFDKYNEKKDLENNLVELKEEQETLEKEVEQLSSNEYVAKIARQKYLFSKEGEIIIKIDGQETNKEDSNKLKINIEEYYKYIFEFSILLIIIFVVKKNRKKKRKNKTR